MKLSKRIICLLLAVFIVVPSFIICFPTLSYAKEQDFLKELYLYTASSKSDVKDLVQKRFVESNMPEGFNSLTWGGEIADLNYKCGYSSWYIYATTQFSPDPHGAIRDIKLIKAELLDKNCCWTDSKTGAKYQPVLGVKFQKGDMNLFTFSDKEEVYANDKDGNCLYCSQNVPINVNYGVKDSEIHYLLISYDAAAGDPITGVELNHKGDKDKYECYVTDENGNKADMNKGAGGEYIYINFSRKMTGTVSNWFNIFWHESDSEDSFDTVFVSYRYVPSGRPDFKFNKDDFAGWYYDLDFKKEVKTGDELDHDTHVYPKIIHTITLDSNGGNEVKSVRYSVNQDPKVVSKEFGSKYYKYKNTSVDPINDYPSWPMHKTGYIFTGWVKGDTTDYKATWINMYQYFLKYYGYYYNSYVNVLKLEPKSLLLSYNSIIENGPEKYQNNASFLAELTVCKAALAKLGYELVDGEFVQTGNAYTLKWTPNSLYTYIVSPDEVADIIAIASEDVAYGLYNYIVNEYEPINVGDASKAELLEAIESAILLRDENSNSLVKISRITAFKEMGDDFINKNKTKIESLSEMDLIGGYLTALENAAQATKNGYKYISYAGYKYATEYYIYCDVMSEKGYSLNGFIVTSPTGFTFFNSSKNEFFDPHDKNDLSDDALSNAFYNMCVIANSNGKGTSFEKKLAPVLVKTYGDLLIERGYKTNAKTGNVLDTSLVGTVLGDSSAWLICLIAIVVITGAAITARIQFKKKDDKILM